MEQGLIDSLWLMGGYTFVIFVVYFFINAVTLRFLSTYLKVRTSMGRKTLVMVKGISGYYYRAGFIDEGFLKYRTRDKQDKQIRIDSTAIGRKMGVNFVTVDEETDHVLKPDFSTVTGWDAVKFNNLHVRALQAPKLDNDKNKWVMILLVAILIVCLAIGLMIFQQGEVLAQLQETVPTNTV